MSMIHRYALPVETTHWRFGGQVEAQFDWTYDDGRGSLLALYAKSKDQQWNAERRINWSQDLDPENPTLLDDRAVPIFGSALWDRLTNAERVAVRWHHQAYTISQFLHGEQGALIATARIIESVPDLDAKYFAATQVMDEARHVEIFSRLLKEKFELAYPISSGLKSILETGLTDTRWDMTYLTMQVLIEGLALAAFQRYRDFSRNSLISSINAYVMQDEARHVAFGRLALENYYPELSDVERLERQEFLVEGCSKLLERFDQTEVWERLHLPVAECAEITRNSETMKKFRVQLFSRIIPTIKHIGLWGPRVREGFQRLGVDTDIDVDTEAVLADDERIGQEFDDGRRRRLADVVQRLAQANSSMDDRQAEWRQA